MTGVTGKFSAFQQVRHQPPCPVTEAAVPFCLPLSPGKRDRQPGVRAGQAVVALQQRRLPFQSTIFRGLWFFCERATGFSRRRCISASSSSCRGAFIVPAWKPRMAGPALEQATLTFFIASKPAVTLAYSGVQPETRDGKAWSLAMSGSGKTLAAPATVPLYPGASHAGSTRSSPCNTGKSPPWIVG